MIDIRTLFLVEVLINAYLCAIMFFFRRTQKVYGGFGYWLGCNLVLLFVYLLLALRGIIPDWLSIPVALGLGVLAAVLRLEGVKQFLGVKTVWWPNFAVPVLTTAVLHYFTVVVPSALVRTVLFAVVVSCLLLRITWILVKTAPKDARPLSTFCAGFFFGYTVILLTHALGWILWEEERSLMATTPNNTLFFLSGIIFDIAWTTSFLALNSHRLAQELKHALDEIKTLSGIIPICMYCKQVRDDEGYWNQIERFIASRSAAQFSHSICPNCLQEKHPEIAKDNLEESWPHQQTRPQQ